MTRPNTLFIPVPFSTCSSFDYKLRDQHDSTKTLKAIYWRNAPGPFSREKQLQYVDFLQLWNIQDIHCHWHSRICIFFSIYYLDWSGSSGWTLIGQMAIGGNGMESLLNGCLPFLIHCDRFINPTLQPQKWPLPTGFWHF
jgi:hypothetical protein